MAYLTGFANSWTDLHDNLIAIATAHGWSNTAGLLSKAGLFSQTLYAQLSLVTVNNAPNGLAVLGKTAANAGAAPNRVGMLNWGVYGVSFPLTYHAFVFSDPDEVYFLINTNVDYWQFLAFGQSDRWGLEGSGLWVAGSVNADSPSSMIDFANDGAGNYGNPPAPFFARAYNAPASNYYCATGIDDTEWHGKTNNSVGVAGCSVLLNQLPNAWNSEAVLLPIRDYVSRPDGFVSIVAELANARYTRVDYYSPGQVIQVGTEPWMIMPFYKKDASQRNGGVGITHSGTYGWAIRRG